MTSIVEWYKDLMYNRCAPLTQDWFLVSEIGPLLVILVSYVYFSTSAGPRYMKDKKPYELRNLMILHNFSQVLLSAYILHEGLMGGWLYDYSFYCQPVDYSDSPTAIRMAKAVHLYYMSKLIELLDTVFFVLRKKNRQISTLHVYHHTLMPICAWIGCKFLPNGHGTLLGLINCFIHVIMYSYYMLSSIGPQMNKYLWWKKYLTTLQLVQFTIIFIHSVQLFFNGCNFPKFIAVLLVLNSVIFIYMFGSFYIQTYIKDEQRKADKRNTTMRNDALNNKAE